mgnify:FL=1
MISRNVFLPEELPYSQLEKIGIKQNDILRLPSQFVEPLMSGRVTPLIMGEVKTPSGELYRVPLKLQLTRNTADQVVVLTFPMRKEVLNDLNLSRTDIDRLKEGHVLRKEVSEYGKRTQRYYQLDSETKSIMQKDSLQLRLSDRIKDVEKIGNIELGLEQKKAIQDGKPVELSVGDSKVTVGVNLKEPTGFKNLQGDMELWKQRQAEEYDRLNPGFVGFIKTDENRWEYHQVVLSLQSKNSPSLNNEHKESRASQEKMSR